MILQCEEYFLYFYLISLVIGCILVIYILNSKSNPSYKITLIVQILILWPIKFGVGLNILYGASYKSLDIDKLSSHEKSVEIYFRSKDNYLID